MREIKFRAWDRELKKMMYGILEDSDDAMLIRFDHFEDENPAFLQYTGLTDRAGNEIYEGDILFCESRTDTAKLFVSFEEGEFILLDGKSYGHWSIRSFKKEVIGNIHDNPELLEG